jgi:hypothetical protein
MRSCLLLLLAALTGPLVASCAATRAPNDEITIRLTAPDDEPFPSAARTDGGVPPADCHRPGARRSR